MRQFNISGDRLSPDRRSGAVTNMKRKMLSGVAASTVLLVAFADTVAAQEELQRGETVIERPRPEISALGVRAGSFFIYPLLDVGTTYEDNVFATDDGEQSDIIFNLRPSVDVRSNFSRHQLRLLAGADVARYVDNSSENYEDFNLEASGRYDITGSSAASAGLGYERLHEGRSDPESPSGRAEPVEYSLTTGTIGYSQGFNRLSVGVDGEARYVDYRDVRLRNGLVSDQDVRDRWEYSGTVRAGYTIQTGYEAFVRGTYEIIEYESDLQERNSDGYEIVVGTALDLTGLITGEVYAGYLTRDYDNPALNDFDGIAFGGSLDWLITELTSIRGEVSRSIRETTLPSASGYDRTVLALGVDHELLRTLILSGRLQYREDDYNGVDRTDDYYTASFGARYTLNRYLYVSGAYTHERRNSTLTNADYDDNLIELRVGAQL